jgi:CBS domain-containing protein
MNVPRSWLAAGVIVAGAVALGARARRRLANRRHHVRDVMVGEVVVIDASASLVDAALKMKEANIGILPVVSGGRLRGLITDRDIIVRAIAEGADPASTLVSDCATRDLICARPDTAVGEAMEVMAECQIGRLPVVNDEDQIVGMVTLSSLALRSDDRNDALHTAQEVSKRSAKAA